MKLRFDKIAVISIAFGLSMGAAGGIGTYTFYYAEGASYFSKDSGACANCHIMQEHFDAWQHSSHHAVAGCNDCHAPHDSLPNKLFVKGVNGFKHSLAFTTGKYPDPLRITDFNRRVTEGACRYCHGDVVHGIDTRTQGESMSCIRCHSDVGHPR